MSSKTPITATGTTRAVDQSDNCFVGVQQKKGNDATPSEVAYLTVWQTTL